ncbi:cytochrome o ubiquinol oxidase subunit IV [Dyella soli]|uniref:Cytochrome bo(3) ubiquinol oxidase subunit 4 n=1 Tax=Dyella soli TaxID=522319 RepID=A0A4R0YT87_9GAMM|nr:cytochrome o ubiquinol oxidase subunit IV [Dyella soli]TCI10098.1 cytochrome o ubiquinol oxidase subunit IV [Dyella soli]
MSHSPSHEASSHETHGSFRSYVMGLLASLALTAIAFAAVMTDAVPHAARLPAIVVLCVVQLYVQLVFFLHLGSAKSQRQNTAIFACTTLLIVIVIAGSLWVMHNANINMMPMNMSTQDALNRQ